MSTAPTHATQRCVFLFKDNKLTRHTLQSVDVNTLWKVNLLYRKNAQLSWLNAFTSGERCSAFILCLYQLHSLVTFIQSKSFNNFSHVSRWSYLDYTFFLAVANGLHKEQISLFFQWYFSTHINNEIVQHAINKMKIRASEKDWLFRRKTAPELIR